MTVTEAAATAVPTAGFALPPYHVESFVGWSAEGAHAVCNRNGFNCLSFTNLPGVKFTTLEVAEAICASWNAGELT